MMKLLSCAVLGAMTLALLPQTAGAQEARRRWETTCQIRKQKFALVLPEAMRENGIDMWIVMQKEGHYDPLYDDLGRGYPGRVGFYVFSDRGGERIERSVLGMDSPLFETCGEYDAVLGADDLRAFVAERDPRRIGVNTSRSIGGADGLSYSAWEELRETLGEPYASRLVSAEKLVSDFRSRRVATEIAAFAEAGQLSREIAERALSNEVIRPGATTLQDVAFWMLDRLLERGLASAFDFPSVYVTGPKGIEAVSNDRVIRPGDLVMIDWGVCLMNLCTDMKRIAYVLKAGEFEAPAGYRNAFDVGLRVRDVVRGAIRAGRTAQANLNAINAAVEAAGYSVMKEFNKTGDTDLTEVIVGCHSVGNLGHGVGPSIAWFNPQRLTYEVKPSNLLSIEFFAWTRTPEWGGAKLRIPIEDDAVVTDRGVEWLYPVNPRILLIGG